MKTQQKYNPLISQRAAHRKALINEGLYGRFKEKSIQSAKIYKRGRIDRGVE